jgi:fatty-acyl-CoA synthase
LGEVAVAFVEMDSGCVATADDVKSFCAANLASFKVPRDVLFVDVWPMTPTGKVQRFRLRELAAAAAETATEPVSSRS